MKRTFGTLGALLLLAVAMLLPAAARAQLKDGDLVAVCGDSITEQKDYSVNIECYLLMCQPAIGVETAQFGWGGETSWGFKARMDNDTLPFKPTVATTCYGMNDGGYGPLADDRAKMYRENQRAIVKRFKEAGVRFIVVGSPGCVDADMFRRNPEQATVYNKTLAELRDIARQVATEEGVAFADVFDPMVDAMTKAKIKYGKDYHLAGYDGVHPAANGHLVMAYAFLKALGCNGDLGTIRVDLAAGKADATGGHKVLSIADGKVELESARYPFCFHGDPKNPAATSGVIELFPFNQELNRMRLVVTGVGGDKRIKVTWGPTEKTLSASELAKGINLAAEFLNNPFSEPFAQVRKAVQEQQNFETPLVKSLLHNLPVYEQNVPEEAESLKRVRDRLLEKDRALRDAAAKAVVPVRHTLALEVVQ